jgi:hypothetical protein
MNRGSHGNGKADRPHWPRIAYTPRCGVDDLAGSPGGATRHVGLTTGLLGYERAYRTPMGKPGAGGATIREGDHRGWPRLPLPPPLLRSGVAVDRAGQPPE